MMIFNLKTQYFDEIRSGLKPVEYRLRTPYWKQRISKLTVGDTIEFRKGYPSRYAIDKGRNSECCIRKVVDRIDEVTITHKHFGPFPVEVFAIWFKQ